MPGMGPLVPGLGLGLGLHVLGLELHSRQGKGANRCHTGTRIGETAAQLFLGPRRSSIAQPESPSRRCLHSLPETAPSPRHILNKDCNGGGPVHADIAGSPIGDQSVPFITGAPFTHLAKCFERPIADT